MIKVITSYQADAPSLMAEAGSLLNVLDKALISGFGELSIDTLTAVGVEATATINSGHSFNDGDVLQISGVDQVGYTGEFVVSLCSSTQFSYTLQGVVASPATGTITCKIAPLNWTAGISGENKKVYIPGEGEQKLYRFEDNGESTLDNNINIASVIGYEVATVDVYNTMLDIDTGYPSSDYRASIILKKYEALAQAAPWVIIGDSKCFYLLTSPSSYNPLDLYFDPYFFGAFPSYAMNDSNNHAVFCRNASLVDGVPNFTQSYSYSPSTTYSSINRLRFLSSEIVPSGYVGAYAIYDYSGIIPRSSLILTAGSVYGSSSTLFSGWSNTESTFPIMNPADNSVYYTPIYIVENDGIRGVLPGAYSSIFYAECDLFGGVSLVDTAIIDGTDRRIISYRRTATERFTFDITGPWQ